jgi:hypothetical protein
VILCLNCGQSIGAHSYVKGRRKCVWEPGEFENSWCPYCGEEGNPYDLDYRGYSQLYKGAWYWVHSVCAGADARRVHLAAPPADRKWDVMRLRIMEALESRNEGKFRHVK